MIYCEPINPRDVTATDLARAQAAAHEARQAQRAAYDAWRTAASDRPETVGLLAAYDATRHGTPEGAAAYRALMDATVLVIPLAVATMNAAQTAADFARYRVEAMQAAMSARPAEIRRAVRELARSLAADRPVEP